MTDQIAPDIDPTTLHAALVELRQVRAEIVRLRPFVDMADRAARDAERMQTVQGRCPACQWTTLFLGDGGHVTCSRLECPQPEAADRILHGEPARAANNGEERPRTTANNPATSSDMADGEHDYLSTGCLHGRHDYCSNIAGVAGSKTPAQCKFCTAPCQCSCHAVAF